MKKIFLHALMATGLLFYACDKDDNNTDDGPSTDLEAPKFDEIKAYFDGELFYSAKYFYEGSNLTSRKIEHLESDGSRIEQVCPVLYNGDTITLVDFNTDNGQILPKTTSIVFKNGRKEKVVVKYYESVEDYELGIPVYVRSRRYEYTIDGKLWKGYLLEDANPFEYLDIEYVYLGDKIQRINNYKDDGIVFYITFDYSDGRPIRAMYYNVDEAPNPWGKAEIVYDGKFLQKSTFHDFNESTGAFELIPSEVEEAIRNASGQIIEFKDTSLDGVERYTFTYLPGSSNALKSFYIYSNLYDYFINKVGADFYGRLDSSEQSDRTKRPRLSLFQILGN